MTVDRERLVDLITSRVLEALGTREAPASSSGAA